MRTSLDQSVVFYEREKKLELHSKKKKAKTTWSMEWQNVQENPSNLTPQRFVLSPK